MIRNYFVKNQPACYVLSSIADISFRISQQSHLYGLIEFAVSMNP